ncbi:hypothetical protein AAZX31_04G107700 [Glycine max]|uniref:Berberine bridge enzyme-like 22 n=1 Tax=Glycine soja TaxID=3848 RepID=A0A0B2QT15_GLYSO|nr:berberine bridge enzyme-like 22 [Glycine soja]KAG5034681.1 hypothetical protein JHK87_009591 [Glycine soja]KAG5048875.1 hypothetical protein JHK85_009978 [Glycine max]KHN24746.1 Reticuline oxidase-like protein [Glycine soja]RZC16114.1 Berberine bridge enzyme-like 22 [Glycine soja]
MEFGYCAVFLILLLPISCGASTSLEKKFKKCLLTQLNGNSESIENITFTSSSSLYPQVWDSSAQNLRFVNSSRKPLIILTPLHESEIQAAILCSKQLGLQIRVRSGGHDCEGLSYLSLRKAPFVMVDLINIRSIEINLDDETAWVQAGATLGELYYKISNASEVHGFPAGPVPGIGIGGHISGGGQGMMMRKHGLAADHVVDAYLIDVNGTVHDRKSMGEDVFWAIRGGSATSFGVILAWKIRLVRVPAIVTVSERPLEEGATNLIHRWQYIAHELHEDLFIRVIAQNSGDKSKTFKATFGSIFLGETDRFITLMNESFPELELNVNYCTEISWIQSVLVDAGYDRDDPPEVLLDRTNEFKSYFKVKSDFVKKPIPKSGLEGAWKMLLEEEMFAWLIMEPYGGRMNEISESEIPFPHRKGNLYSIEYVVKWEQNSKETSKKYLQWAKRVYRYMTPYVSKSPRAAFFNFKDLDLGKNKHHNTSYSKASVWGNKYFKGNFRRLAQIKTKFDPQNFFRNEQSIPLLHTHPS